MIGVGDLAWTEPESGVDPGAWVPGTGWSVFKRRRDGRFYALMVGVRFGYRTFDDGIDLQCWLCTLTEEGNR
jgi:hypothetical protein